MCGIAGTLGQVAPDAGRIENALRTMDRRGPDASGHQVLALGADGQQAALLHTRFLRAFSDVFVARSNAWYMRLL